MALYSVQWEIDIQADSPEDAARQAMTWQMDPDRICNVFRVRVVDEDGQLTGAAVQVDLDEEA